MGEYMDTASKITYFRKKLGKSQEAIAEALGLSRQAVAKWESGESLPDINNILSLSKIFGISVDYLVKDEECQKKTDLSIEMTDSVTDFLCKAKRKTYAGGGHEIAASRIKSHDFKYTEGELEYYDSYLGGEKFAGEEGLWKKGIPFWSMNYIGRILDNSFSGDFLKEALLNTTPELPYRGPEIYKNENKIYSCSVTGNFDWFYGREVIYHDEKKVYECLFHGGSIK
jgi:DNA-binding XRE family transcriptional regulator